MLNVTRAHSAVDHARTRTTHLFSVTAVFLVAAALISSVGVHSVPDLIVVQVPTAAGSQLPDQTRLRTPLDRYVDGSRIVLIRSARSEPLNLTPEFAAANDPEVSFDGRTVLFAGKRGREDTWQIWSMSADGSNKVQITSGAGDSFAPVYAGSRFYLNDPAPTPQIIYASTAHGWLNEQAEGPALALYGTDVANDSVFRLTYNLHSDFAPDVLPDGRIVFTSWQHFGDRYPPAGIFAIMSVNLDGTDLMPYYGNHEMPLYKEMVSVADFGDRVYFIEADRLPWLGGGDIAYVSRRRPLHSYRKLSHDRNGLYHSPVPLPDGGLIASYRADVPEAVFGLYRVDPETGRRGQKVFEEDGWHSIDAQVLISRPSVKGKANWLIPGATTGVFYCLNSYTTDHTERDGIEAGTVKFVRVVEGLPLRAEPTPPGSQRDQNPDRDLRAYSASAFGPRRLLGVAPVEEDGSFHIRVPAGIPITFQLLDEDRMAIRTQMAWTWVIGNENRGCIGCHEDRELSPPNRMVAAVIKPAVELTLPPERRRTVDFRHQIAPIIEAKCAIGGCHVAGQTAPDLTDSTRAAPASAYSAVYQTLLEPIQGRGTDRYVIPGTARDSPLIWLLLGRRTGSEQTAHAEEVRQMPPHGALGMRDRILFIEWVDLGAQWDSHAATAVAPR